MPFHLALVSRSNHDESSRLYVGNLSWHTSYDYDVFNDLVRITQEATPTNSIVTEFVYDANRNLALIRSPEAVNGRQTGNVVRVFHDERDLPLEATRVPGTPGASTIRFDYDGNGNRRRVSKVDAFAIKQQVVDYDGFNRLTALHDAMGNVRAWRYDPNSNPVSQRTDG